VIGGRGNAEHGSTANLAGDLFDQFDRKVAIIDFLGAERLMKP
jgi:hypothetical protein